MAVINYVGGKKIKYCINSIFLVWPSALFGKGGDAESFSELADGANVVVLATSLGFGFGEEHDVKSESEKR